MQNINQVAISGNLTQEPQLRKTKSDKDVLSLSIASNDRRKNPRTGEWEDVPNFVDCVYFGANARALSDMLDKGAKVFIAGKLRYSTWETDGNKRSKIEIIADNIEVATRPQKPEQAAIEDY